MIQNILMKKNIIDNEIIDNDIIYNEHDTATDKINIKNNIENYKENIEKLSINKLEDELYIVSKRIIKVKQEHIDKCKQLFDLFNILYIVSPGEAEELCAKLIKKKLVYGVYIRRY